MSTYEALVNMGKIQKLKEEEKTLEANREEIFHKPISYKISIITNNANPIEYLGYKEIIKKDFFSKNYSWNNKKMLRIENEFIIDEIYNKIMRQLGKLK